MTIGIIRPYADLAYRLRRLGTAGALLHLGVHPDDEEAGMMAFVSRGLGLRAVYWSATRGESGQNRFGPERGEALGIVRTWESLDAREIDGAEVRYGPFYDFGFARSARTVLEAWGKEHLVEEIVRAIRLAQPQVVVCRWRGEASDGHGQHQALGLVVAEAFEAAADPGRFPAVGPPWRALKLYRSTAGDWQPGEGVGSAEEGPEAGPGLVRIDVGTLDPVTGRTFHEQAAIGINRHRTQAMELFPEPGSFVLTYRLDRAVVPTSDREEGFFDGIDPSLAAIADAVRAAGGDDETLRGRLTEAQRLFNRAADEYHPARPADVAPCVLAGLEQLRAVQDALTDTQLTEPWRRATAGLLADKEREAEETAALTLGIRYDCLLDEARATPNGSVRAEARLWTLGPRAVEVLGHRLRVPPGWSVDPVGESGRSDAAVFVVGVPSHATPSTPYWLREPRPEFRYSWPANGPLTLPFDPPSVEASCDLRVHGSRLTVSAAGVRREAFPGGFRELPLAVLPPVTLRPKDPRELLPAAGGAGHVSVLVEARCLDAGGAKIRARLRAPAGWTVEPPRVDLAFAGRGEVQVLPFTVTIPKTTRAGAYRLAIEMESPEAAPGSVLEAVRRAAPGLLGRATEDTCVLEAFIVTPSSVEVHVIDVVFPTGVRVGYVPGIAEEIVTSLRRFDLDLHVLGDAELTYDDLSGYDAILIGPNAYPARDTVRRASGRLLGYVEGGGRLIVQYQGYAYDSGAFAPYPFRFNRPHDRVTAPRAEVTFLLPDHQLLTAPNRITTVDFEGWVHDRGMYFFGTWDPRYRPVLASADPGEEPRAGGLLVAGVGKGTFVYCAYTLHRQIPAGVPGAFRLLANLLGLARGRGAEA